MKYMNRKVTYLEKSDETKYTYITPNNILTTNKRITKKIDHKNNI